jgi:hypothetical protein
MEESVSREVTSARCLWGRSHDGPPTKRIRVLAIASQYIQDLFQSKMQFYFHLDDTLLKG